MKQQTKYTEYKWTLILAPGEIDRDWRIAVSRKLRAELLKGFYIGCIFCGAALAGLHMILNWRTLWN